MATFTQNHGFVNTRRATVLGAVAVLLASAGAIAVIPFAAGASLATPLRPSGAAIADFNGDGLADLAVTADTPDRIILFFGAGAGGFGPPQSIQTGNGTGPESLIAADINGDGRPDLVVSLHNAGTVRSYINSGAGAFALGSSAATGADPHAMTAVDIDGDGDTDFVTANRDGNNLTIIRNTGGVLAAAATVSTGGIEPRGVAAGDFNHDGAIDLAVTNHRSRTVTILNGGAGLAFSLSATLPVLPDTRPDGIAAADLDHDGDIDLVVAISETPAINVVGVYSNGGGSFSGPASFNTGGVNPSRVAIADLDLDGKPDVVVGNEDSGNISILQNTTAGGSISLAAPSVMATGAHPEQFAVGDVNGNGAPDLAVPNRDANTTSILTNSTPVVPACRADFNGSGSVTVEDVFAFLGAYFLGSTTADFNGRGGVTVQDVFDFLAAYFAGCP